MDFAPQAVAQAVVEPVAVAGGGYEVARYFVHFPPAQGFALVEGGSDGVQRGVPRAYHGVENLAPLGGDVLADVRRPRNVSEHGAVVGQARPQVYENPIAAPDSDGIIRRRVEMRVGRMLVHRDGWPVGHYHPLLQEAVSDELGDVELGYAGG